MCSDALDDAGFQEGSLLIGIDQDKAALREAGDKLKEYDALKIVVENKKDCPLYTGTIIREVKVSPSPEWLRKSLELIGCRSVNNVVDITNYILFTWGEPLHAFDLDKLAAAEIIIRRAKEGERITTIDGSEKKLTPEILVIADAQKSQAVAGVMGSRDSEVSFTTKNILLEAALFDAVLIRRGRQKIGLQSESSYRFERGIDAQTLLDAKTWAIQMILEICGGRVISAKASSAVKIKPAQPFP